MKTLVLAIASAAVVAGCQHPRDLDSRAGPEDTMRKPGSVETLPRSAWPSDATGTGRTPERTKPEDRFL